MFNVLDFVKPAVYPRWRGEHFIQHFFQRCQYGLSPLARGTLLLPLLPLLLSRFIPAGAGNTHQPEYFLREAAVYPRWRGEHHCGGKSKRTKNGLSPLARGTLRNNWILP